MGRFALYLLVTVLTFCVGSLAHTFWPNTSPPVVYRQPRSVTLCELTATPERYDGEEVQVRAVLYRNDGEPFISDDSCASPTARIHVQTNNDTLALQGLPEWATYTTFCGNDPYPRTVAGWAADIIIVGTFKAGYPNPSDDAAVPQPFLISKRYLQITWASRRQ